MQTKDNGITIKEALEKSTLILKKTDINAPALEAGVMLCNVLKCDRAFLYSHGDRIMTEEQRGTFFDNIEKRRKGVPLQYITGYQEFMSLLFKVSPKVLIPRQDTEVLVETVITHANKSRKGILNILDMGTGSGCIAISLAYYIKNCNVTAVDISEGALEIAGINAQAAGVSDRINFVVSDLFSNMESDLSASFDIIVSNPPYIAVDEIDSLQVEVKCHEPYIALNGGNDGLDFYRAIINASPRFLSPGGLLAFEVGYNQSRSVAGLMEEQYCDITAVKDLSNIERVVLGRLKDSTPQTI